MYTDALCKTDQLVGVGAYNYDTTYRNYFKGRNVMVVQVQSLVCMHE